MLKHIYYPCTQITFEMKKYLILALPIFLFLSCSQNKEPFVYKGAIHTYSHVQQVFIDATPDQSYYVYIPTTYNAEKSFPLVMCFSPKADGRTPVDSLRFAAETFGYIIAGSNEVRNNYEGNLRAVKTLLSDIQNKYLIDASRIFACGFSGGARLATSLGAQGLVKGVISCSASPGNTQFLFPIPWYGIGGKADFNYNEMTSFHPKDAMKSNYITTFHNKGHEWPDSSFLYDGLAFLHFKSMKWGDNKIDQNQILGYQQYIETRANSLEIEKQYIDAANLIENSIVCLDELTPTDDLNQKLLEIKNSPGYQVEMVRIGELKNLDKQLMETYASAFISMDIAWWKSEIIKLEERLKTASGDTRFALLRIKGSLGIIGYMYSKRFIALNRHESDRILSVYELLEPENPDMFYFKALYAKKKGRKKEAQQYFDKALKLGLSDAKNLQVEFEQTTKTK